MKKLKETSKKSLQPLSASVIQLLVMAGNHEATDNGRIAIRSRVLKKALLSFCRAKRDGGQRRFSVSDATQIAIELYLPKKYLVQARRELEKEAA
jgi:hypothetical protein